MIFNKSGRETVELNNLYKFLGISPDEDERVLSEATYFSCMKVLSESVGKLPLKLLRYNDKHGVETARKHYLYNILHDRPNPYMTATTFWSTVGRSRSPKAMLKSLSLPTEEANTTPSRASTGEVHPISALISRESAFSASL